MSRRRPSSPPPPHLTGVDADPDGPPPVPSVALRPRPQDPGPTGTNPALSVATRARLEVADLRRRAELDADEPGSHVRTTIALALGTAALAGAWRLFGGRGE